jgi:hypothetical protein
MSEQSYYPYTDPYGAEAYYQDTAYMTDPYMADDQYAELYPQPEPISRIPRIPRIPRVPRIPRLPRIPRIPRMPYGASEYDTGVYDTGGQPYEATPNAAEYGYDDPYGGASYGASPYAAEDPYAYDSYANAVGNDVSLTPPVNRLPRLPRIPRVPRIPRFPRVPRIPRIPPGPYSYDEASMYQPERAGYNAAVSSSVDPYAAAGDAYGAREYAYGDAAGTAMDAYEPSYEPISRIPRMPRIPRIPRIPRDTRVPRIPRIPRTPYGPY